MAMKLRGAREIAMKEEPEFKKGPLIIRRI
jgi:hypothetical protein